MNEKEWKAKWQAEFEELLSLPGVTNLLPEEDQDRIIAEWAEQQWQNELDFQRNARLGLHYLDLADIESCVISVLEKDQNIHYIFDSYPNGARKYILMKSEIKLGAFFLNPAGQSRGSWKYSAFHPEFSPIQEKITQEIQAKAGFMLKAHSGISPTMDTAVSKQPENAPQTLTGPQIIALGKKISHRFKIDELHDLAKRLSTDYENLPGDTRDRKAHELVDYANRHGKVSELLEIVREERPRETWSIETGD